MEKEIYEGSQLILLHKSLALVALLVGTVQRYTRLSLEMNRQNKSILIRTHTKFYCANSERHNGIDLRD